MTQSESKSIVGGSPERFGYSWNIAHEIHEIHKDQFDGWTQALPPETWQGARFLDVGCGIGRNSHFSMQRGAVGGLAVDVDDRSLDAARRNLADYPDMEVRWQSVYDLNEGEVFDLAFSIGVVHHLENPEEAVQSIAKQVKPGGKVLLWLYGAENNGWVIKVFDPVRRFAFARMPLPLVNMLAWPLTLLLWVMLHAGWGKLPYHDLLRRMELRPIKTIVLDQMVPRITRYYDKEGALALLRQAGLVDLQAAWVNNMSWSVSGTKPEGRSDVPV